MKVIYFHSTQHRTCTSERNSTTLIGTNLYAEPGLDQYRLFLCIYRFYLADISIIKYSLCFLPSVIVGRLFDIGLFNLPFFLASCLLIVATFLTAQCKLYWHFLLCQGFAVGVREFSIKSISIDSLIMIHASACIWCTVQSVMGCNLALVQTPKRHGTWNTGMWIVCRWLCIPYRISSASRKNRVGILKLSLLYV